MYLLNTDNAQWDVVRQDIKMCEDLNKKGN
jgi:hypothetical protein